VITSQESNQQYLTDQGSDRAKAYQVLVEQLGTYSKDLRNLESANLVNDAQRVVSNLRTTQEHDRKEVKEQIAEQAHHLIDSTTSYQNLTDDLQRS